MNNPPAPPAPSSTPHPTDADLRAMTVFSVQKAGMNEASLTKINQIVYEYSKDSPHFLNQHRKDEKLTHKINTMLKTLHDLEASWRYLPAQTLNIAHQHMINLVSSYKRNYLQSTSAQAWFAEQINFADHHRTSSPSSTALSSQPPQPPPPNSTPTCTTPLTSLAMYNCSLHMDLDSFFASATLLEYPHLTTKPVAIGSLQMISTSNYVARAYGVRSAQPGFIAKKLCPNLIFLNGNIQWYSYLVDSFIRPILFEYDPNMSSISLDEAGLDLTSAYIFNIYQPCLHLQHSDHVEALYLQHQRTENGLTKRRKSFKRSSLYSQPSQPSTIFPNTSTTLQTQCQLTNSFLRQCVAPKSQTFQYYSYIQRLNHLYKHSNPTIRSQEANLTKSPQTQPTSGTNTFLPLNPHHLQNTLLSPCSFCLIDDLLKEYGIHTTGVLSQAELISFLHSKLTSTHVQPSQGSPLAHNDTSPQLTMGNSANTTNLPPNQLQPQHSSLFLHIVEWKLAQLAREVEVYEKTVQSLSSIPPPDPSSQTPSLASYLTQITAVNDSFRGIYPHSVPLANQHLFSSKSVEFQTLEQLSFYLTLQLDSEPQTITSPQPQKISSLQLDKLLFFHLLGDFSTPTPPNTPQATESTTVSTPHPTSSMSDIYTTETFPLLESIFSAFSTVYQTQQSTAIRVGYLLTQHQLNPISSAVTSPKLATEQPRDPFSIPTLKSIDNPKHHHRAIFRYGRPTNPLILYFPIVFDILTEIRLQIFRITNLTSSYGVAATHMLAKVTSDHHKPFGHCLIPNTAVDIGNFMTQLAVRKIPGVGRVLEKTLNALKVEKCGDLVNNAHMMLRMKHVLGKIGFNWIIKACCGGNPFSSSFFESSADQGKISRSSGAFGHIASKSADSPGSADGNAQLDRKSMSYERTFRSSNNVDFIHSSIDRLCAKLYIKAKNEGTIGRCVTVKVKYTSFVVKQRSQSFEKSLNDNLDNFLPLSAHNESNGETPAQKEEWRCFAEPIARRRFTEVDFQTVPFALISNNPHAISDDDDDDGDTDSDDDDDDGVDENVSRHNLTNSNETKTALLPLNLQKQLDSSWLSTLQKTAKSLFDLEFRRALKEKQEELQESKTAISSAHGPKYPNGKQNMGDHPPLSLRLIGVRLSSLELNPNMAPQNSGKSKGAIASMFGRANKDLNETDLRDSKRRCSQQNQPVDAFDLIACSSTSSKPHNSSKPNIVNLLARQQDDRTKSKKQVEFFDDLDVVDIPTVSKKSNPKPIPLPSLTVPPKSIKVQKTNKALSNLFSKVTPTTTSQCNSTKANDIDDDVIIVQSNPHKPKPTQNNLKTLFAKQSSAFPQSLSSIEAAGDVAPSNDKSKSAERMTFTTPFASTLLSQKRKAQQPRSETDHEIDTFDTVVDDSASVSDVNAKHVPKKIKSGLDNTIVKEEEVLLPHQSLLHNSSSKEIQWISLDTTSSDETEIEFPQLQPDLSQNQFATSDQPDDDDDDDDDDDEIEATETDATLTRKISQSLSRSISRSLPMNMIDGSISSTLWDSKVQDHGREIEANEQKVASISRQLSISNVGILSLFHADIDDDDDEIDDGRVGEHDHNHLADTSATPQQHQLDPVLHPLFTSQLFTSIASSQEGLGSVLNTNTSVLLDVMNPLDLATVDAIWDQ